MKVELTAQMELVVTAESGVDMVALRVWAEEYWERGNGDAHLVIKFPDYPQPGSETLIGPSVAKKRAEWIKKSLMGTDKP